MFKLTKKDFQRLQWSLLLFVLLTAIGAIVVSYTMKAFKADLQVHTQAEQTRHEASTRALRARDEEQELREKIAIYERMAAKGIIGQEHRLDWIDAIRKIKQDRKLLDVSYEIGPQEAVSPDIATPSLSGFDIMSSPMRLDMKLLHENDLLGFVSDLRSLVKGFVRVRQCDVWRAPEPPTPSAGPAPQLLAKCELDWITIRERR